MVAIHAVSVAVEMLRHCEAHRLPVQREDDHVHAQNHDEVSSAREVLGACQRAGLEAEWAATADVPFPFHGGVRLADQAQIDPMPLLASFIRELTDRGGLLVEGTRVRRLSHHRGRVRLTVRTRDGEVEVDAGHCVLATGMPIFDRGWILCQAQTQQVILHGL